MLQIFGLISAFLATVSMLPYFIDIVRNKTKPQRTTWFIYSVLCTISFFSQLAKGAEYSLWFSGVNTVAVIVTFILSIRYGMGGMKRKDYITLCFAVFGLILWYLTKEAAYALFIVILIDLAGTYLTIEKTRKHPETETASMWAISSVSAFFGMLAVGSFNIVLLSYPFYIFAADLTVAGITLLSRNRKRLR